MDSDLHRKYEFDVLRICAITCIMIHHINGYVDQVYSSLIDRLVTLVSLGLLVFMSGALIAERYPVVDNKEAFFSYFRSRILRVYPQYLPALLLFAILKIDQMNMTEWSVNFLSLSLILSPIYGKPVKTLWFVVMIMNFYGYYLLFARRLMNVRGFILTALFLMFIHFVAYQVLGVDRRLMFFLPPFILGIYYGKGQSKKHMAQVFPISAGLVFLATITYYASNTLRTGYINLLLLETIMIASIVPLICVAEVFAEKVANKRLIVHLSNATYGAYLFHRVIYKILLDIHKPNRAFYIVLMLIMVGIPLTYSLSALFEAAIGTKINRIRLKR